MAACNWKHTEAYRSACKWKYTEVYRSIPRYTEVHRGVQEYTEGDIVLNWRWHWKPMFSQLQYTAGLASFPGLCPDFSCSYGENSGWRPGNKATVGPRFSAAHHSHCCSFTTTNTVGSCRSQLGLPGHCISICRYVMI